MRRRRAILFAALALAAPVPAFALAGGSSGAGSLDAHASLDSCGVFQQQIVCKFDVSFNEIAGADRYTASVTAPDGSVSDYGGLGAGGGSVWVPYAGDGSYTVTVDAWGGPPKGGKPSDLVATDDASAGGATAPESGSGPGSGGGAGAEDQGAPFAAQPDGPASGDSTTPPDDSSTAGGDTTTTPTTTTTTTTACVPPPPPPPAAPGDQGSSPEGGDASTLGGDAASADTAAPAPDSAATPQCPDGSAPVDGTCCPQPSGQ